MSIENEIASLTQSTTGLLTAVNTKKAILDTAVTNAEAAATDSTAQAVTSTSAKNSSEAARDAAVVAKNAANTSALNAAAVVTGGTATIVPQAGKIPLADSEGIIDADWLPAEITGRNVFAEDQAKGNAKYAASGFVHFGKHRDGGSYVKSNQGLFSNSLAAGYLNMGQGSNGQSGESKEAYPVLNIAGIETKFRLEQNNVNKGAKIKFPDAPNGTVTYDSATGAIVDYTTDTDPKYGDVASTTNEAVARAFEGVVPYGDFRNGVGDWTSNNNAVLTVTDGVFRVEMDESYAGASININTPRLIQGKHTLRFRVKDASSTVLNFFAIIRDFANTGQEVVAIPLGSQGEWFEIPIDVVTSDGAYRLLFEPAGAGAEVGRYLEVSDMSFTKDTTEVVTERVDMYGFEGFLEEVTTGNPYVYPNGLIQSQATSMDGANTSASNRPATYYAVFDGDTGSVGKGVNFNATTNANKVKMFSNPKNNLYWIEGSLFQWRVRQRTIAGTGNGDWKYIDSTNSTNYMQSSSQNYPQAQAASNTVDATAINNAGYFPSGVNGNFTQSNSIYKIDTSDKARAAFGECYFLVCGTVPRLNQGVFHPSFNPMGTASGTEDNGGLVGGSYWYDADVNVTTKRDAFNGPFLANTTYTKIGRYDTTGSLSSTSFYKSGRPDGKFYDVIYASGQGGVIDNRLSAWDKSSPEDASKVDAMLKNGSYRGVEKLIETVGFDLSLNAPTLQGNSWDYVQDGIAKPDWYTVAEGNTVTYPIGQLYQVTDGISEKGFQAAWVSTNGGQLTCRAINRQSPLTQQPVHLVFAIETTISVSGEFTQTDVVGDPANILLNPDLKDGWMGSWIPDIPDGVTNTWPFSRKSLVGYSDMAGVRTDDNGQDWDVESSRTFNTTVNSITNLGHPAVRSVMYAYTAFAKQTKVANNEQVFNGEAGVGSVLFTQMYLPDYGSLLTESLLGKIPTSSVYLGEVTPSRTGIRLDIGEIYTGNSGPKRTQHPIVVLPASNTVGAKLFDYAVVNNQQLNVNYAYEELIYDGDLGDDGFMAINSGQTTNTDDNGNTVLTGTNTLALPYGWSKNNI